MDHLAQPDEALATLVDGVMGDLYTGLAALPEPEARRLAFNVLLNGLSFVLEDMRSGRARRACDLPGARRPGAPRGLIGLPSGRPT
jgi:hypothetical protein